MATDRARQFLPFDALKGYREAIKEKERIKVEKIELSEESLEDLSYRMNQVHKGMIIKVTYFSKDVYLQVEGMVSEIDTLNRVITIVKKKINFDDILKLESNEITSYQND